MKALRDPIRLIPLLFGAAIVVGTLLLSLPLATQDGVQAPLLTALFTATSAVSVTGLIVVDTPTYWSFFGQVTILLMFQIGGFGIMTAATLFGLMAGRGFGLRQRMATQVERSRLETGDAAAVLRLVLLITLAVEAVVALVLAARMMLSYAMSPGEALWHGVFHSVSAFNNAGFSTHSDSVIGYQTDPVILGPIMLAVVLTALGFPVMQDI
ncbi:MAG: TrkH family potassium uptake protein, partial [Alphaproteobacteria bacterium]|nr:TrkH family potassium uptake protein [Alphaproteobacteria bacterium]